MSEHTPGPWVIRGQDIIGNDINGYICTWSGYSGDAHLIAAAPDLLEALELLLEREWQDDEGAEKLEKARSMSKAAIAKARGES